MLERFSRLPSQRSLQRCSHYPQLLRLPSIMRSSVRSCSCCARNCHPGARSNPSSGKYPGYRNQTPEPVLGDLGLDGDPAHVIINPIVETPETTVIGEGVTDAG